MALVLTYEILKAQFSTWLERNGDSALVAEVPYLIMLAEDRLARELKVLGTRESVTASFIPGQSWVPKPVRWRETVSMNFGTGPGYSKRNQLFLRDYHFCREYWPNPTLRGTPRYYSDYLYDQFLIVPTPIEAFPFELLFWQRHPPLDDTHETNWWTANAPAVLHNAAMLEAKLYLKDAEGVAAQEKQYDRAISAQFGENARQKVDGASEVKEK
jgi:hypothetical protein